MHKRQVLALAIPYLLGTVVGIGVGVAGTLVWGPDARAASYNLMFNNVEQGPGSTANPSLSVNGGEAKKSQGDLVAPQIAAHSPVAAEAPAPAAAQASPASAATVAEWAPAPSVRHFRLGLHGAMLGDGYGNAAFGGALAATVIPVEGFGVTAFGGLAESQHYFGGELEVTPLRLSVFGLKDFVEGGVMAGASSLGSGPGLWGSVHGGARVAMNFGDRFSIAGSVRQNLSGRSQFVATVVEAGLTVRF